jgi:hypothetical protein
MKNLLFFLLLGVLLAAGCREDDDEVVDCDDFTNPACSNYNPCHDQEEVSAAFETSTVLYNRVAEPAIYEVFVHDTFLVGNRVTFEAEEKDAEYYEWKVGSDDRSWHSPSFSLEFSMEDSSLLLANPIPVTLIVRKKPNKACFPDDDGLDTLTKFIYFVRFSENLPYIGTWRGVREDNPSEVYDIKIYRDSSLMSGKTLFIDNLENDQVDCVKKYYFNSWRTAYNGVFGKELLTLIPYSVCAHKINYRPLIRVNTLDNTIEVAWLWNDYLNTTVLIPRKFKGKKID